jgi:type I restriction enzyme R subunit
MQSQNFEFLRPNWVELSELGALAEFHAQVDPSGAAVKLRAFAEQVVLFIYHQHGLPRPYQCNLNDLLNGTSFQQCVPRVIVTKLHTLRVNGNKAAHGEPVPAPSPVLLLQEAYELGRWMHLTYAGGAKADCPPFVAPVGNIATETEKSLKREKTAILARVAANRTASRRS